MTADLVATWERFRDTLKLYNKAHLLLHPPCSVQQIQEVEKEFHFELPSALKTLLMQNNGQRTDVEGIKKGVFKSVSGWDVYERHVFLSLEGIKEAYQSFVDDKVLVEQFGVNEIPFAVAASPVPYSQTSYKEAFCINSLDSTVSLIWTQHVDPMNPPEWQVARFARAASLIEFVEKQIELYR